MEKSAVARRELKQSSVDWRAYIDIARVDHWVKNVFVLPGIIIAAATIPVLDWRQLLVNTLIGLFAVGLVTSSNYVINEIMDAPFDRHHPTKRRRPVPSGRVVVRIAYVEWMLLMVTGISLALLVSAKFAATLGVLWIMGLIYNIPPIRFKDIPYVDVVSEAVNNPLRMIAGWYIALPIAAPPASLLLAYWMAGCYFMATKRFAEYREINDRHLAAAYRRSFASYDEAKLLVSIMFYAAFAMLMFGAFIIRYGFELVLSFPLVATVMARYLALAFDKDSAAHRPEGLYREPRLMIAVTTCGALMIVLMFVDLPGLAAFFSPLSGGMVPQR